VRPIRSELVAEDDTLNGRAFVLLCTTFFSAGPHRLTGTIDELAPRHVQDALLVELGAGVTSARTCKLSTTQTTTHSGSQLM